MQTGTRIESELMNAVHLMAADTDRTLIARSHRPESLIEVPAVIVNPPFLVVHVAPSAKTNEHRIVAPWKSNLARPGTMKVHVLGGTILGARVTTDD
jgi:hypothetical protein